MPVVSPAKGALLMIPYRDQKLAFEKVFRDPIHNYIYVDHQVILDLINSREFQRLRRIRQLGASSFTFHGAEHTRFGHSLGVYEITRQICDLFERNYPRDIARGGWDDEERLVALCAALLHDIGHGPYSHTFEQIFRTNHEAFTTEIITSPETEVYKILSCVGADFPEKVAAVIKKTYPNPQVVQLISSQIDADRMDYLLRDAYYTGTKYGTFDLTRILRVIRPYQKGIVFQMNGMHAVEDYIVSRYQMYLQVYFHPVSRSMEVILDHLLERAHLLFQKDPAHFENDRFLLPFLRGTYTLANYLKLDDGVLNTCILEWAEDADGILADLSKRFLNRKPFKSVLFTPVRDDDMLDVLAGLVQRVGFDPAYYTALNSSYDQPYDFYHPHQAGQKTPIMLIEKDGSLEELSRKSALVAALAGQATEDHRFYFPREMLETSGQDLFQTIYREFQSHIVNDKLK